MANDTRAMHRRVFPTAHKALLDRLIAPVLRDVQGDVLVIGAGKVSYRALMPAANSVFSTDIDPGEDIDLVADAHDLPIQDKTFDCVIAIEVFEHLRNPFRAMQEISRVLRSEGQVVLSVPFMFRVHGDPYDYQRFTASGLGVLFDDHFEATIQPFGNRLHVVSDIVTTAWKGLAALRVFNHALRFRPLSGPSRDCPSGFILQATKRGHVPALDRLAAARKGD